MHLIVGEKAIWKNEFISQRKNGKKCRKVIDAFAKLYEIEDEDMIVVDVGRYGFVKLQCFTPSYGFEELDTYTDSSSLFEGLWEEWFNLNLFLITGEM